MTVQATKNPLYIKHHSKATFYLGNNTFIKGAVCLDSNGTAQEFFPKTPESISIEDCHMLAMYQNTPIDLVIIGTGLKQQKKSMVIGAYVQALGMRLEWATTPVAIDIWNICIYDAVAVAALILPVKE